MVAIYKYTVFMVPYPTPKLAGFSYSIFHFMNSMLR